MEAFKPSEKFVVIPGLGKRKIVDGQVDVENQTVRSQRLRGTSWLPNKIRNHFIAMLGEFVGTFLFLFFAFAGCQVATTNAKSSTTGAPNTEDLMYIALSFGFSLAVNVWVFFRISGGLFNPAVTLGMCLIGAVPYWRGFLVFLSQIVGGIAAAGVVSGLFPDALGVRTTLRNTSIAQGLFIEMFLTFMLVFTVFMLAAEKHKGTYLAPIGIGLALFIAELAGVYFTGGSLNPARSFGPDVVTGTFDGYHWIYWVGPALGSILAVVMYRLIKVLEYETANPGQDFDENEIQAIENIDDPETADEVRRPPVASPTNFDQDEEADSNSIPSHNPLGSPLAPTFTSTSGTLVRGTSPDHDTPNLKSPYNLQNNRHSRLDARTDSDTVPARQPSAGTSRAPAPQPLLNGHHSPPPGSRVPEKPAQQRMLNGHHSPPRSSRSANRYTPQQVDGSGRSSKADGQNLFEMHQPGSRASEEVARPHGHFERDPGVYQGDDDESSGEEARGRAWR